MKIFDHYKLGVVLGVFVIIMFLIVSTFFCNNQYFKTSIFLNSFIIPAVFVFFTLMGLLYTKKKNGGLSFKQGFKYAYFNQLIGFVISIGFILLYMNVINKDTRNIFNYQYYNSFYQEAKKEYDERGFLELPGDFRNEEQKKQESVRLIDELKKQRDSLSSNFFSFQNKQFILAIFAMNLFYLMNSLFLSLFVKTPKQRQ